MKKLFSVLLLLGIIPLVNGQGVVKKIGDISQSEVDYAECPSDKDAEAVVFFDKGRSYFIRTDGGFQLMFEHKCRIKILKESGLRWAEVEIPIYQEGGIYESVSKLEAHTYNYANRVLDKTTLERKQIFEEQLNERWKLVKFAFPEAKVGSIIEFKYTVKSDYIVNLRDWEFQKEIPVLYSEYQTEMIPFYEYTYLLQGAGKFDFQESNVHPMERHFGSITYSDYIHRYGMRNVPAFVDEGFMTSKEDYIIKLDFQLSRIIYPNGSEVKYKTTWDAMISDMVKSTSFGKYQSKCQKHFIKSGEADKIAGLTEKERFNSVISHVKEKYQWDGYYGRYSSKSAANFVKETNGNVVDINLYAIGALNAANIEAYPVLISTRGNGRIPVDYPFIHFFDYVVILAYVDGKLVLSDATELNCKNERIPLRCINERGLIINKEKIEWVTLQQQLASLKQKAIKLELSEGSFKASFEEKFTEYDALSYRTKLDKSDTYTEEIAEDKGYDFVDGSIKIENRKDNKLPLLISYDVTGELEVINDKIYLNPLLNEIYTDPPLKQKKRTYPVDLTFIKRRHYRSVLTIPEGYELEYIPEPKTISNLLFELNYSVFLNEGKVVTRLSYQFKKAVYSPEEYARVKYYFKEIVKYGNEKLVLKKL